MSIKMRQEVERKIIAAAVNSLLAAGFTLTVDHEEGTDIPILDSSTTALDEICACDEEHLIVHHADDLPGAAFGYIFFVYGNDGWDVISDYSTNLETYLADAMQISDHYSN